MARKTRTSTSRRRKTKKSDDGFYSLGKGTISIRYPSPEELASMKQKELERLGIDKLEQRLAFLEESTGGLWRMQDGTLIQIRQMSDSHLHNAIRHMESKGAAANSVAKMKAEQQRRKVDRQWAARTTDPNFADGRTFADSGIEKRIEKLERQARAQIADTALDVRLQVATALTTIRRLVGIENIDVVRSLEKLLARVLP